VLVPLVGGPPLNYGLFSGAHLLDVINLLCLVAPFLLVAAPLLLDRSPVRPAIAGGFFWPLAVTIPLAIPLLIDPKLGMARDWDLLSLGVVPLGIYAAITIADRWRALPRGALLLPSVAAAGVLAMFVGINAHTGRSIQRFEHLLHLDRQRGGYGYEALAYFYHTRGQSDKIIQSWRSALELENNPRYWMQLSTVYNQLGDRDNALSTARECYFADTSSAAGAYSLANSFSNWGLPDSVSRYLHLAARLGADNVQIQHDLAAFLYLHNRLEEARHYIEAAIALAPDSAAYYNVLGAILIQTGEFGAAVTTLNRALVLHPNDKDSRLNLALAYFLAGQRQQALTELSRVSRETDLTAEEQQAITGLIARIHQADTASATER
jgi:tetratricopeptide (TPR) repeat protein